MGKRSAFARIKKGHPAVKYQVSLNKTFGLVPGIQYPPLDTPFAVMYVV